MRRDALVIACATLAARFAIVVIFGIRDTPDSGWYIKQAVGWRERGADLLALFSWSEAWSPLFVALIAGLQPLFNNWRWPLVGIQTVLSAGVPATLYLAARRGGVGRKAAWAAALLAMLSYELSRWNAYVLTDALFIVFSAATMCATIVALSTRSGAWAAGTAGFLVGAMLARPAGPAVAFAVVLAASLVRPPARRVVAGAAATIAIVAAFEVYIVSTGARGSLAIHACTQLIQGRVIFGFPEFSAAPLTDVSVPDGTSTAECLIRVAANHPGHVARVLSRRAIVYWLPVYPNYSIRHNLANLVLLGVPLLLAAGGLFLSRRAFRDDVVRVVGASFVVGFGLFHTATWSEGDHRLLAPVLPAVYLLAGLAVDRFVSSRTEV